MSWFIVSLNEVWRIQLIYATGEGAGKEGFQTALLGPEPIILSLSYHRATSKGASIATVVNRLVLVSKTNNESTFAETVFPH